MKRISILMILLLAAAAGKAQYVTASGEVTGSWNGEIKAGSNSLPLVLNFSEDGWICTLDSPAQGVMGIAAEVMYNSADSVAVNIPSIGASFKGAAKGSLCGIFEQSGMKFEMEMVPGKAKGMARPQEPVGPFPYVTEEVSFTVAADWNGASGPGDAGVTICGTLTYPVDYDGNTQPPLVVMVTGSGQQNRDEEVFGHKPFLVIADYLARHGIASLRYDDRGIGESGGDPAVTTTYTNMQDAMAGVQYVRDLGRFGKVGILGHSEGGSIAFMAAGRHPESIDFVVSLAGTAVRGDSVLVEQNRKILPQQGVPQKMADDYCKVLKEGLLYKINGGDVEDSRHVVDSLSKECGVWLMGSLAANLAEIIRVDNPWLNYFVSYDPAGDISAIQCPVLALNGSLDSQVVAATNLGELQRLTEGKDYIVTKEYLGLNHLFQHCTEEDSMDYGLIEETISPEVLSDVAEWINNL